MHQLYQRLLDFTGDGVYRYAFKDGRLLLANRGLVRILDLDCEPEALVGRYLRDLLIYTEKEGTIRSALEKAGELHGFEYHFKTLKGADRWVIHDSFLINDNGEQVVEAIVRDITPRKLIEQELADEKEWLAVTLRSIGDAVIATDSQGRIELMNGIAEQLTGWPNSEALGRALPEVFHIVNERTGAPCDNPAERVLLTGGIVGLANHTALLARGGTRISIADSGAPIRDSGGRVVGVVLVFRDVTEARRAATRMEESEANFRALAENASDGIMIVLGDGRAVYANRQLARIAGLTPEQLFATNVETLTRSSDRKEIVAYVRDVVEQEVKLPQFETALLHRSRREIPVEAAIARTYWLGQPAAILVFHDITTSKKVEAQLRGTLREKDVLLKEIHHRVKNNLQVISSLLNLQAAHVEDPQALQMFADSRDRIKSMALIHEKLYQSGNLARVSFGQYITGLTDQLLRAHAARPDAVALRREVEDISLDIDAAIACGLIVNELVSNALKHAFPDARQGEIVIRLHADQDGCVTLVVADNGVGLPPGTDLRAAETLGLQLVSTLVQQLRGSVEVDGGEGTRFTIRFMSSTPESGEPHAES